MNSLTFLSSHILLFCLLFSQSAQCSSSPLTTKPQSYAHLTRAVGRPTESICMFSTYADRGMYTVAWDLHLRGSEWKSICVEDAPAPLRDFADRLPGRIERACDKEGMIVKVRRPVALLNSCVLFIGFRQKNTPKDVFPNEVPAIFDANCFLNFQPCDWDEPLPWPDQCVCGQLRAPFSPASSFLSSMAQWRGTISHITSQMGMNIANSRLRYLHILESQLSYSLDGQ